MLDDGLLRAAKLFVAKDVLQDGVGGGQSGGGRRRQTDALNLIAVSAYISNTRGQFDQYLQQACPLAKVLIVRRARGPGLQVALAATVGKCVMMIPNFSDNLMFPKKRSIILHG